MDSGSIDESLINAIEERYTTLSTVPVGGDESKKIIQEISELHKMLIEAEKCTDNLDIEMRRLDVDRVTAEAELQSKDKGANIDRVMHGIEIGVSALSVAAYIIFTGRIIKIDTSGDSMFTGGKLNSLVMRLIKK